MYAALLKLGSSKVAEIVKESRVSYSKVYDVLERLGLKGLVSHKTIKSDIFRLSNHTDCMSILKEKKMV